MEQMLCEVDVAIGKDILKMLPAKMDALAANMKEDNTTDSGSTGDKTATIDIINNSPLITGLDAVLAIPVIGNSGNGKQKMVKLQGYKGVLYKNEDPNTKKIDYDLQIPLQNPLVTFKRDDTKETYMLCLAATIPLEKIAQMAK